MIDGQIRPPCLAIRRRLPTCGGQATADAFVIVFLLFLFFGQDMGCTAQKDIRDLPHGLRKGRVGVDC